MGPCSFWFRFGFGDKDSNLDKQSQSLLSCRWTIPENGLGSRLDGQTYRFASVVVSRGFRSTHVLACRRLYTTVYLVRNAETAWNTERRLAGRRELGLSDAGRRTASTLVSSFAGIQLEELLVSPLPRAVETAQPLAEAQGLQVARDPRLIDWNAGEWEGRLYSEIVELPLYKEMATQPVEKLQLPNGERFADVLTRMLASVEQALSDNELGASIAIVSHAGPLRFMLSHYLSVPPWEHERLRLDPGSVTTLRFSAVDAPPALVSINRRVPLVGGAEPPA
jgi:broad specificity phosphatase PhoE